MSLYYEDGGLRLFHGSNKDILPTFADEAFDSIVTDPPYELGFMGKGWDSSGIAYDVEVWRECFRVLKPGGYLLSFGGTRTWHRIATAIEDAGFEIRDSIAWMYGSGFPKSMDVSKAIDKRPGVMRHPEFAAELKAAIAASGFTNTFDVAERVIGRRTGAVANWQKYQWPDARWWPGLRDLLGMDGSKWDGVIAEAERVKTGGHKSGLATGASGVGASGEGGARFDEPATEAGKTWAGWGTALKPAFEPIIVARKPLAGTVAANVLAYGTGALNIDANRVSTEGEKTARPPLSTNKHEGWQRPWNDDEASRERVEASREVMHDKRDSLGRFPANVLLDESQAEALDGQSGTLTSGLMPVGTPKQGKPVGILGEFKAQESTSATYGDSGGASRFFPTFRYEAKAPGSERPEVDGVAHATVKPLDLMRWLVRLVTRRGGHVLDPFAGSGTTGEAALLEGMESTLIELESDHLPLILARVKKPLQPSMFGDWEEEAS